MRTPTQEAFFSIIRYEIAGTPLPEGFCVPDMDALVKLADDQDLTHLVYDALTKNGIPCSSEKAFKQYCAAIWRVEQLDHELQRLSGLFEDRKIDFIPLKGCVMRGLYPQRWMRTSADIDILFRQEQEKEAERLMAEELGYVNNDDHPCAYHGSLHSPENHIHIEPHWALFDGSDLKDLSIKAFSTVWERAVADPDGRASRYMMSDADLYAFHVAHMEKHFRKAGGCSVRSLIDLWMLDRLPDADIEGRRSLLEQCGLTQFEKKIKKLIYSWMDGEATENEYLEQYVLNCYLFGNQERGARIQTQKKGSARYILERIFMPYDQIKLLYPVLEGHPWLLPAMWVRRWTKVADRDSRKRFEGQVKSSVASDKNDQQELKDLLEYLGI